MNKYPLFVQERLKKWFSYPEREIHCQVATTFNDCPHVRTMKLYEITDEGFLVVLSRNDTQKWRDLEKNPRATVLLLNEECGQMIAEGAVELNHTKAQIRKYWERMPFMIQKIYFNTESDKPTPGDIPGSFGVIFIQPSSWDVLEICKDDYLKSTRRLFRNEKGSWSEQDLNPV